MRVAQIGRMGVDAAGLVGGQQATITDCP